MLYGRRGETITCQNGHYIATLARDVEIGALIVAEMFDAPTFVVAKFQSFGQCPRCDACFGITCWPGGGSALHFEQGWRIADGEMIYHIPKLALGDEWPVGPARR